VEYFTVAKQYHDGQEPDIAIGVEENNPFGWKREVLPPRYARRSRGGPGESAVIAWR
jgi:hypothetical protein